MIAQTDAEALHARLVDAFGHVCLHLADRLARERAGGGIGNAEEASGPSIPKRRQCGIGKQERVAERTG